MYITPEMAAVSLDRLRHLRDTVGLALVAVDEAHCISEWGFDFRTEYRHLYRLREALPDVPFLALTATATPKVGWVAEGSNSVGLLQAGPRTCASMRGRWEQVAEHWPARTPTIHQPTIRPHPNPITVNRCATTSLATCASSPIRASEWGCWACCRLLLPLLLAGAVETAAAHRRLCTTSLSLNHCPLHPPSPWPCCRWVMSFERPNLHFSVQRKQGALAANFRGLVEAGALHSCCSSVSYFCVSCQP